MSKLPNKKEKRERRHSRIRATVSGTATCPRLCVFRSNRYVYAQLINDEEQKTLAAADSRTQEGTGLTARAHGVGTAIAQRAKELGVERAVFDRGGFLFAGVVREVAEGAREGGLQF